MTRFLYIPIPTWEPVPWGTSSSPGTPKNCRISWTPWKSGSPPPAPFQSLLTRLAVAHPQVRCVLGAHNHMNMNVRDENANYVTASSFVETPFEFKLFEISAAQVAMSTHSLLGRAGLDGEYDFDRTFVQGREKDRSFSGSG